MPRFFETRMGRTFYEGTMPALVAQLKRLADASERAPSEQTTPVNRSKSDCLAAEVQRFAQYVRAHIEGVLQ